MEAFAGTDGLGNPSYVVVGKRWGAGAARTEERDVRKKEARYPNTINKLSQFAAGENNAFDAGMMREKVTVSAEPTNGGDRLEFTRQGVYNRWLDFGPSLLRVCMTATAATTGEPAETDFVVRQSATLFDAQSPLVLASGETLGPITVAFQTYGELTPARDNAIFICHALTGDAHVAGRHQADERKPGWWDGFVGPGKAIDTDRYFVICANILGFGPVGLFTSMACR